MNADSILELIHKAEQETPYGTIALTIKRHESRTTTIDLTKITSQPVSGNAQALTIIGTMLRLLAESKESGNLTFTITLEKGNAKRLLPQDFKRVNISLDK